MVDVCKRALVEGRVQGVWFRGSTQQQARRLGIVGWARNLPDGRVEVLMSGDDISVSELERWLHQGPPLAKVRICPEITSLFPHNPAPFGLSLSKSGSTTLRQAQGERRHSVNQEVISGLFLTGVYVANEAFQDFADFTTG